MYESLLNFPGGFFNDFERLRQALDSMGSVSSFPQSIRSLAPGAFPAVNVGRTPKGVEVYAFAPGIDPSKVDVVLDQGVLTISGERPDDVPGQDERASAYSEERFTGRFKRAVSLPEDIDPNQVSATYRDGILRISISRQEAAQPKRVRIA